MSKSESIPIIEHLQQEIKAHFSGEPFFVAGVSGGPDSMALLYGLYKLSIRTLVVHINYGMRGEASDLDQELVEGFCAEWGFECCSVQLDGTSERKGNFQHWARRQRYQIFRDLAGEYNADAILTAHHRDDQVETILQKVLRGAGPSAWQGMKIREQDLFRPLLQFTKNETLSFCEENNIPFHTDESNQDSRYARNFLRNELTGSMDQLFPGWQQNLLRLQEFGRLNDQALDHILDEIAEGHRIEINKLGAMEPGLRLALIKRFAEKHGKITLTKGQLDELEGILSWNIGAALECGREVQLVRDRTCLTLKTGNDAFQEYTFSEEIAEKGIETSDLFLHIENQRSPQADLYFDAEGVIWPLRLRPWQHGDFFHPLGMDGTQKVSDHLTNRKIPSSVREKALILSGADGTIHAVIYPCKAENGEIGSISDKVKITSQTRRCFTITTLTKKE